MRALVWLVLLGGCGAAGGGGGGDLGAGDLGPVACRVTVSGAVNHDFPPCLVTLCLPNGGPASVLDLQVNDQNLGLRLNAQVMGAFAARAYAATDLTVDTTFQLVENVASTMQIWRAFGGLNPPPGQTLALTLAAVAQPAATGCGAAHGTIDATLLPQGPQSGTVAVHASF